MTDTADPLNRPQPHWQVYIILCSDGSLYTGITNDIERRLGQHSSGRGAKYFRGRQPRQLVYLESGHTRSSASQKEAKIKKLQRGEKLQLVASDKNEVSGTFPKAEVCLSEPLT